MPTNRHPGITMHKLSFGGGLIGLIFSAGSALIFLLGFPTLWYFVALAFGLGVAIALFMRLFSQRRSEQNRPLSIVQIPPKRETLVFSRAKKIPSQFRLEPQSGSA